MATVDIFKFDATAEKFPAGKVIFNKGDKGDYMYIVQEGEVEIRLEDKVLETVGEGGVIGELAIIEDSSRSATAICKTDCKLVQFDQDKFTRHILTTPFFAVQIMKVMADRLRKMNEKI